MSVRPATEPTCSRVRGTPAIATLIEARPRDLGGFSVGRVLPAATRRSVGPFVFLDHMGPADFVPGHGIDVRPHPHIGLATVTYLFEGEIVHRDSLGSVQPIRPGEINWMTAGRGIVHSERTEADHRRSGSRFNGLQLWVALPLKHEETEPEFHHHDATTLPVREAQGTRIRVLAGSAFGMRSPVKTLSPLFFADVSLQARAALAIPPAHEHEERAVYVVDGTIGWAESRIEAGHMLVLERDSDPSLLGITNARVAILGGAPLDGERHLWWNFVSSSKARIEQAKGDWKAGRFAKVPGDEMEYIPLPD